jgi:hypothetical protein
LFYLKYHVNWTLLLPRKHAPRWYKKIGKKVSKKEMMPNRISTVEHQSQYVRIRRVENRGAEVTNQAMENLLKRFKTESRQSITIQ